MRKWTVVMLAAVVFVSVAAVALAAGDRNRSGNEACSLRPVSQAGAHNGDGPNGPGNEDPPGEGPNGPSQGDSPNGPGNEDPPGEGPNGPNQGDGPNGYGPGDGDGNDGEGPNDGTGYGPGASD